MLLTQTQTYPKLIEQAKTSKQKQIKDLTNDSFFAESEGLKLDYSRNLLDQPTLDLLVQLAEEVNLKQSIDDMFVGKPVNTTENRAALHTALRNTSNNPVLVDGEDVMPDVNSVLAKIYEFSEKLSSGNWTGQTDKPIKNIVNIGIGGSSLGPEMAVKALGYYNTHRFNFFFVSNVDPADFYEKTLALDPAETLFIVASKTFTTQETMANARLARDWITKSLGEKATSRHFVAVSTNRTEVEEFGIDSNNMFEFWDWVGGRYSLFSSIGLSLVLAVGKDNFEQMCAGANSLDNHFLQAEFDQNLPVLLGLIGVWNRNFLDIPTEAVLPYSQYLSELPSYLQQLSMESNGKSVSKAGERLDYQTAAILWGEAGTNGQHSFHQLLHQGTQTVAIDLIGFDNSPINQNQQSVLNANLKAQAEAFAIGESEEQLVAEGVEPDLAKHKQVAGNKPCNVITAPELTPFTLGQIIALYEHKVFVEGVIWDINSFDQFGVELGKKLAKKFL